MEVWITLLTALETLVLCVQLWRLATKDGAKVLSLVLQLLVKKYRHDVSERSSPGCISFDR